MKKGSYFGGYILGVLPEALRNEMLELGKSLFQELPEAKG